MKFVAVTAILLLIPCTSAATTGENEWRFGAAVASTPALALDAGILHDFTDFWAFGASVRGGHSFTSAPTTFAAATADLRLAIDALQWIPAIELGLGAGLSGAGGPTPLARGGLSLAWRPARSWGVVVRVEGQASTPQNLEMWGGLQFVHFGGSGIGLDL